jgi:hypothetical protein
MRAVAGEPYMHDPSLLGRQFDATFRAIDDFLAA